MRRILCLSAALFMALSVSFMLTSCITTLTEPLALSFEEKIVIRGVLKAGEPVRDIAISKSLPALSAINDSATAVYDATGTLSVNGRTFPLVLQNDVQSGASLYTALNNGVPIIAEADAMYTLNVQWNGKSAAAQTSVPSVPQVQDIRLLRREILSLTSATYIPGTQPVTTTRRDTLFGAEIFIIPLPETAYRASVYLADVHGNALTSSYDGTLVLSTNATNIASALVSGLLPLQTQTFSRAMPVRTIATITAFDKAYYHYALTRSRGQQASNLFGGTNGENVIWNVSGDGIGLFIGVATVERVISP